MGTSLFLVGFMGSGKTTLGPILAAHLELPFIDLDDRIQSRVGVSIPEIFKDHGEREFRRLERQNLVGLKQPGVVALGAGAFSFPKNRITCRTHGTTVFLDWPLHILVQRVLADSNRPMWGTPAQMKLLLARRKPAYHACDITWRPKPPFTIGVSQTARELLERLVIKRII